MGRSLLIHRLYTAALILVLVTALPAAAAPPPTVTKPMGAHSASLGAKAPAGVTSRSSAPVALLTPGWAPPAYVAMVKGWHATGTESTFGTRPFGSPPNKPPTDGAGRAKLVLVSINHNVRVALQATTERGDFPPLERDLAMQVFRADDGSTHPVEGRLLDLLYAVQRHFHAPEIRFLSGYRVPHRGGSNHGLGRAVDLVVPGATDAQVAEYARQQGFVGVGLYPTSGFVHLDVRDRSFFWVDRSGPGTPNRTVSMLASEVATTDAQARARGVTPTAAPAIGRDVSRAIAARARGEVASPPPIESDSHEESAELAQGR